MGRTWKVTIQGEPASKANSRRPTKKAGWIKSEKALLYEQTAKAQLGWQRMNPVMEGPVRVTMTVYYATRRPDFDVSLIEDVLQGYVYKNDRQIRERHNYRGKEDKLHPRAEIVVEEMT